MSLGFHVDTSEVTLNVCLGRSFEGGSLFFRGVRCPLHQQGAARAEEEVEYTHAPGMALLHRGKHRHGAHAITSGERHNLILWCRADPVVAARASEHRCHDWCWARGGLLTKK